uniref:PDZ domain-containing protein n=1 Tax=Amphiprion percula TaxID=161767 RepID=A0A3P8UBM5_AMPPE
MGSEQVAQVLRQCGNRVKLVVTRGPVEENPSAVMPVVLPTVNEQQVRSNAEAFDVSLTKNTQGLGITIAGYQITFDMWCCFSFSSLINKNIDASSAYPQCPNPPSLIHGIPNDRPLQVDGVNIQGYTNQQAVEVLRHTGQTVHLKLIRRELKLSPFEEEELMKKWQEILGPSNEVVVSLFFELYLNTHTNETI